MLFCLVPERRSEELTGRHWGLATCHSQRSIIPFYFIGDCMSRYYNVDLTLSRNRLFNFVVGMRGVGKTYSSKRRAIKNYLQKGKQFVYLRRYDTELKKSEMSKFFDDIYHEFPDTAFKVGDGAFFINNKVAGWYIPLSKSQLFKSVPFPNVSLIIFDEFIIDVGTYRYLPNEVTTFL